MRHKSLSGAPMVLPDEIRARKLGRNEKCWCGSDKKYKHCHWERHSKPKVRMSEMGQKLERLETNLGCLHPDATSQTCSGRVILSHTVQKSGGLRAIAEENHVVTARSGFFHNLQYKGRPPLRRVGIGKANTFPGFCSAHDSATFQKIETNPFILDEEWVFLHGYRAVCYEHFAKIRHKLSVEIMREADAGRSLAQQEEIQNFVRLSKAGIDIAIAEGARRKHVYDQSLLSHNFSEYGGLV